jgi:hypothetical protein
VVQKVRGHSLHQGVDQRGCERPPFQSYAGNQVAALAAHESNVHHEFGD